MHNKHLPILALLLVQCLTAVSQVREAEDFLFDIHVGAGLMKESFRVTDPSNGLGRKPTQTPYLNLHFRYFPSSNRYFAFAYNDLTIGTSAYLPNSTGFRSSNESPNYSSFAVLYGRRHLMQVLGVNFGLSAEAGVALNVNRFPQATSVSGQGRTTSSGDTAWFVLDSAASNRSVYPGVQLRLAYEQVLGKRFSFTASVGYIHNLGRKDVTINRVTYRAPDDPNLRRATLRSTGNVLMVGFGLGYRFGSGYKKEISKTEKAEIAAARRFAFSLNSSTHLANIKTTDPAGFLDRQPYLRSTYGARVHWEVKQNWVLSTGFESFPNTVDARRTGVWGGNGYAFPNAHQIPLMLHRRLFRFRALLPFEFLGGGGIYFGFKRGRVTPSLNPSVNTFMPPYTPVYYEEKESVYDVKNTWFNAALNAQLNMHVSRRIFLFGYITKQLALTAKALIQSDVSYRVSPQQQEWFRARQYANGAALQPGFGLGCRF